MLRVARHCIITCPAKIVSDVMMHEFWSNKCESWLTVGYPLITPFCFRSGTSMSEPSKFMNDMSRYWSMYLSILKYIIIYISFLPTKIKEYLHLLHINLYRIKIQFVIFTVFQTEFHKLDNLVLDRQIDDYEVREITPSNHYISKTQFS